MNWKQKFFAIVVVAALVAHPNMATASPQQTPQGKQWSMKYEMGTEPAKTGTKVEVAVVQEKIVARNTKRALLFSIPVNGITGVSYDSKVENRAAQWWHYFTEGAEGAGEAAACGVLVGLAGIPVLAPFKTQKHFVTLTWQEEGIEKRAMFKVGKREYAAFLEDLKRITGQPWLEQPQDWERDEGKGREDTRVRFVSYVEDDPRLAAYGITGEPAFRFPVRHLHKPMGSCEGFLYVTRLRILYDPAYSPQHSRDAFNSLRTEIPKVSVALDPPPGSPKEWAEIVLPNRKFHFESLFSDRHDEENGDLPKESLFWKRFHLAVFAFDALEREFQVPVTTGGQTPIPFSNSAQESY